MQYFSLPSALEKIMQRQDHPRTGLQQSVMQHLHLLLTTAFGEYGADEKFGCSIWDHDFDNVTSVHKLKELIRQSLLKSIEEQEKRLGQVRVEIIIIQEEIAETAGSTRVKKRIDVKVQGILHLTNEPIVFRDSFFVGPLSY